MGVGNRFTAARHDLVRDPFGAGLVDVVDDNLRSPSAEEHGVCPPEVLLAARAGDDRDLSVEPDLAHVVPSAVSRTCLVQRFLTSIPESSRSHVSGVRPSSRSWYLSTRPCGFFGSSDRNSMKRGTA